MIQRTRKTRKNALEYAANPERSHFAIQSMNATFFMYVSSGKWIALQIYMKALY